MLNNGLNEIPNRPGALAEWEFEIRSGVSRATALELLDALAVSRIEEPLSGDQAPPQVFPVDRVQRSLSSFVGLLPSRWNRRNLR